VRARSASWLTTGDTVGGGVHVGLEVDDAEREGGFEGEKGVLRGVRREPRCENSG
jgi:hypothetical protein